MILTPETDCSFQKGFSKFVQFINFCILVANFCHHPILITTALISDVFVSEGRWPRVAWFYKSNFLIMNNIVNWRFNCMKWVSPLYQNAYFYIFWFRINLSTIWCNNRVNPFVRWASILKRRCLDYRAKCNNGVDFFASTISCTVYQHLFKLCSCS